MSEQHYLGAYTKFVFEDVNFMFYMMLSNNVDFTVGVGNTDKHET